MKITPSHFTARVEIERQISFFSFGFARVTEVRHIHFVDLSYTGTLYSYLYNNYIYHDLDRASCFDFYI